MCIENEETCSASKNVVPITNEFLKNILKKKIKSFKSSGGSNPGDNYTSILVSLEIYLENEKEPLHLLFKTFPQHPTRQKLLEDTNLFLKEYQIYDIWFPELNRFQKSVVGNAEILVPAMPKLMGGAAINYADANGNWQNEDPMLSNFVLMVDVRKTYGFKMADKLKGLGYHHVKVVLTELAKYHALCHAYRVHHNLAAVSRKFPFIEDPFFTNPNQRPTLESMFKMNMELITDTLQDFFKTRPQMKESLKKFMDPVVVTDHLYLFLNKDGMDEEEVESIMRVKPNRFSGAPLKDQWIVVGHGDCWTNNMLFKKDDTGKVTDTVLVDLQISRESDIMADIVYFIYTSTEPAFRKQYLDEVLALYHEKFVNFCKILKVEPFPGFTLENFQRRFHRSKIFGFLFATLVLPIILQRPETTVNMDNLEVVDSDNSAGEEFAQMFQKMGRDEDDKKLLRDRFSAMISELYEEGVL